MQQFARAGDGFARKLLRKRCRQARLRPGLGQRFGEQEDVSGPDPDTAVTASISVSSSIHSTAPVGGKEPVRIASRCVESALRGTATVMPRPIAAGVFGMARTRAQGCASAPARNCSVRPAMIDTTTVDARNERSQCRERLRRNLRLHRNDDRRRHRRACADPD